ncbi:MAG: hypothetical protein ACTSYF_15170 [Promethearchaeota archaeon]
MVSITIEKTIFIAFGLIIFSIVFLPFFNMFQDIVNQQSSNEEFNNVVKKIELGVNLLEANSSIVYENRIVLPNDIGIKTIESMKGIEVSLNSSKNYLSEIIYSRYYTFYIKCFNKVSGQATLLMKVDDGVIYLSIL